MLMHCLEWWLYEIAGFLAGIISEVELAAQSVMYQLAATAYVVTLLGEPRWGGGLFSAEPFSSCPTVSRRLLCCCKRSCRKRARRWEHGTSQAVQQGLPHLYTYGPNTVTPPAMLVLGVRP